jgi:hypothetical protein
MDVDVQASVQLGRATFRRTEMRRERVYYNDAPKLCSNNGHEHATTHCIYNFLEVDNMVQCSVGSSTVVLTTYRLSSYEGRVQNRGVIL